MQKFRGKLSWGETCDGERLALSFEKQEIGEQGKFVRAEKERLYSLGNVAKSGKEGY